MLAGVGKRSRNARNQSLRELPAKRAISGKQVVCQQPMPELSLSFRDDLVRLRELLDVIDLRADRIAVGLRSADL